MKRIEYFRANDGECFDSEEECAKYDSELSEVTSLEKLAKEALEKAVKARKEFRTKHGHSISHFLPLLLLS